MSNKLFSEEEMEQLKASPYVQKCICQAKVDTNKKA